MAEMKDMYKLTKYVASTEYDSVENNVIDIHTNRETLERLIRLYMKKTGMSRDGLTRLIESSLEHDYIKMVGNNRTGVIFDITPVKGAHLIAKKWFIPVGLIDESLKQYSTTVTVVLSGTFGALILYVAQKIFG